MVRDTGVVGRVAVGEETDRIRREGTGAALPQQYPGDEEVAAGGGRHLLALQRDPGPVLGREEPAVPGPVEGGGRGRRVGDGAVEGDGAALRDVLGPRPLYPRLHRAPVLAGGGRVLHEPQAGVLHLQPHTVADLGQRVDAALVAPAVPHLGLVDDQGPVVSTDLRPDEKYVNIGS